MARSDCLTESACLRQQDQNLDLETDGTKPLVFEDGTDSSSQGNGLSFRSMPDRPGCPAKTTVKFTILNVFPAGVSVTYEE